MNVLNDKHIEGNQKSLVDVSRRRFLQFSGGLAGAGLLFASCRRTPPDTTFLGKGDIALLNYLFIMETIMAAFYTRSYTDGPSYYGLTTSEMQLLADLRDHQLAHKGVLSQVLGRNVIPQITPDLSLVTFADRTNTLNHAIMFEDLAVGAYNGAISRFSDSSYVYLTAKMASVQARHAAYVRDVLTQYTFADSAVVDVNGLDQALAPSYVMGKLKPYILTHLDFTDLPA